MVRYPMVLRTSCLILISLVIVASTVLSYDTKEIPSLYQELIFRLARDGLNVQTLSSLFADSRSAINLPALVIYLNTKEDTERYQKFLTSESILLARKYLRQNLSSLKKMEACFHVEKEVVVAILLIESRFGENIGKYRVIPTLATLALMDSPENIEKNFQNLRQYDPEISLESVEAFAKRRAQWAYQELKCFLKIIDQEKMDPLEVYGSHAGALGMAQFIPSSYLNYALPQKGFENWLLSHEDAINSIGNYLSAHGWKKRLSRERKERILMTYNQSEPYVETVLRIAQKLKGTPTRGESKE